MQSDLDPLASRHSARASMGTSTRAFFFSDTHLFHHRNGAGHYHLKTLHAAKVDHIYAVGDTLDLDAVDDALERSGLHIDQFPTDFIDVLNRINFPGLEYHVRMLDILVAKAAQGVGVTLITGNHDLALDILDGHHISGIKIRKDAMYRNPNGERFLVEHGHLLDPGFLQDYQGWYRVGSYFLNAGLAVDDAMRRMVPQGGGHYHVSNFLKKVGKSYIGSFVDRAMNKAKSVGADGIICGHIHKQDHIETFYSSVLRRVRNDGAVYINCGDGLTHGTSVFHDGQWRMCGPQNIPRRAAEILETHNPYEKFRNTSFDILQTIWEAHLDRKLQPVGVKSEEVPPRVCPDLSIPVSALQQSS